MTEPMATSCYCGTCPTCTDTVARPSVADPLMFRHTAIKHRMLARIGSTEVNGNRSLDRLGTREDDDPTIALIDAFAGSLHILAWNAARLSDDGSIRRTEDRDALVDLTRLLGYEPRPALAATTTLAFTLDTLDGSPKVAKIPKGTKVASVPGQDEKPQTFETDADLDARAEWNALKPVLAKRLATPVDAVTTSIIIAGASTTAKVGDLVLVHFWTPPPSSIAQWLCGRIAGLKREPNPDNQPPQTRIELKSPTVFAAALSGETLENSVIVLGQRAAAFGATAPDIALMSDAVIAKQYPPPPPPTPPPPLPLPLPTEWLNLRMPGGNATFATADLDAVYPDAMQGRFVFFTDGTNQRIGRITSVRELARKGFGLAAKVSQINLTGIDLDATFTTKVRETAIYIETARETLLIVDDDVQMPAAATDRITVKGTINLPIGRRIVLSGEEWTAKPGEGPRIGEVATLRSSSSVCGNTELVFERVVASRFRSATLNLLANSVGASHGETPANGAEPIGSGNAASPSPRFQLRGSPLAYVPATNPRGYAPAIEVRVGDRLYAEKPTIFGLDSADRAYTVRTVRDGKSEVQFAGRLRTGTHNVNALYRVGGGKAGNLAPGRITTAMTPVIGVGAASNPVPAEGASDAETIDDMRSAAPQSIRTLDRVVSLADFEAFAKAFRGIGKAIATELHVGMRSVVCITIATSDLTSPVAGSDVVEPLRKALALVIAPGRSIRIEGFTDLTAQMTVALVIDPVFRRSDVEAAVRAALGTAFGRAARNFGEALHRSAVLAAIQDVEGVIAATLTTFAGPRGLAESEGRLLCPAPAIIGGVFNKAGLLSIDPAQVKFAEMLP